MENHLFLWLRNRTTDNRKCEKARNIKGKRTIEMFNTVSRPHVAHLSSPRDNWARFSIKLLQKPRKIKVFRGFAYLYDKQAAPPQEVLP